MAKAVTEIRHFGFMVDDASEYAKMLTAAFPAMIDWKFDSVVFTEEEMVMGEPCTLRIAIAQLGDVTFELVEAVDSPDSYQAKAERGLHHIAYVYEGDFNEEKDRLLAEGFVIDWASSRNDGEEVYYFKPKDGGLILEVNNDFDYETRTVRARTS